MGRLLTLVSGSTVRSADPQFIRPSRYKIHQQDPTTMSPNPKSNFPFHEHRAGIAVLLIAVAGLLQSAANGGSQAPELLGASKKSVSQVLGEGQPLVSGLFNEEASESHSGGIGSTHAYRTRIGYLGGRSCYAFFMKKTGETFNPIEVIGLLYLCANHAEWRELEVKNYVGVSESVFVYQATNSKGTTTGRTHLATLDETARRLFVYSPEWRPDFNRELWITPDEAPVHRDAEPEAVTGKQPRRRLSSKQVDMPEVSDALFGKSAGAADPKRSARSSKGSVRSSKGSVRSSKGSAPSSKGKGRAVDPKRVGIDPKQGTYLPKLNKVVPADPAVDPKAVKRNKRKRRQQQKTKPIPPSK